MKARFTLNQIYDIKTTNLCDPKSEPWSYRVQVTKVTDKGFHGFYKSRPRGFKSYRNCLATPGYFVFHELISFRKSKSISL